MPKGGPCGGGGSSNPWVEVGSICPPSDYCRGSLNGISLKLEVAGRVGAPTIRVPI